MKEGWALKSVKDVALVIAGQSPEGRYYNADKVGLPFYQGKKEFGEKNIKPSGVWTSVITKTAIAGDILMSVRAPVGPVNVSVEEICIGRGLAAIRQKDNVIHDFLYYFFKYYEGNIKGNTGAVFDSINKAQIENIPFLIPPIPEQQRIVSIIDEAFEAIDKAIENTQKNLQNAKELFESYLNNVFKNEGHGWEEKKWCDVLKIISGRNQSDVEDQNGRYPILGSAGKVMGYASQYLCEANTTIIGRKGTINSPMFIEEPFWNVDTAFGLHSGPSLNSRFLYYFCCSYDFTKEDKGSGRPSLVKSDLLKLTIPLPSLTIQIEIVKKIDTLKIEIQQLQSKYQQKLRDLEELKKSVLNKAFAGEL